MRKKILTGFLSIAFLLLFSVVVTIRQLNRLSVVTQLAVNQNIVNVTGAKHMLDSIQKQNILLFEMVCKESGGEIQPASSDFDAIIDLTSRLSASHMPLLDTIAAAKSRYDMALSRYDPSAEQQQRLDWFAQLYGGSYRELCEAIVGYMVVANDDLRAQTDELSDGRYRVIIPSVLTLIVILMIIGMFSLFIDLYFVKPVVRINKSLDGYIRLNQPFEAKMTGRDEVHELRESIEELISLYKSLKNR